MSFGEKTDGITLHQLKSVSRIIITLDITNVEGEVAPGIAM